MPILRTNYPLHMEAGSAEYHKIFVDALAAQGEPLYNLLFNVSTTGGKLDFAEVAMGDLARIPARSGPTADMQELSLPEEWKKTYTVTEYAAQFQAPVLHWDAMAPEMKALYPQQFAASAAETVEYQAWGVFRNAFSDTGPDGVSLCNANHPLQTGGVVTNTGTAALAASALKTAYAAMMRFTSPNGKIQTGYIPKYLVVPPELLGDASELTNAKYLGIYSSGTGVESDANPIASWNLQVVCPPQISESNDWFLVVDPAKIPNGLRVVFAKAPDFLSGVNTETRKAWGNTDFAFATGYSTWRPVWGSTGGS